MRRRAVLAAIALAPWRASAQGLQKFEKTQLTIVSGGSRHRFTVELALTPEQMSQGLMFRRSMPADAGMLFDYRSVQPVSFWMRNTFIPLDMIFILPDGKIAGIHERAVPLDERPIASPVPVRAVLEVNGGTATRLGIRAGDRVVHPIFEKGS